MSKKGPWLAQLIVNLIKNFLEVDYRLCSILVIRVSKKRPWLAQLIVDLIKSLLEVD